MHLLVLLTHTVYVCVVSYCVHWLVDMLLSDCAQQLLCAMVGGYAACQTAHSRNHTKFTRLNELTLRAFSTSIASLSN